MRYNRNLVFKLFEFICLLWRYTKPNLRILVCRFIVHLNENSVQRFNCVNMWTIYRDKYRFNYKTFTVNRPYIVWMLAIQRTYRKTKNVEIFENNWFYSFLQFFFIVSLKIIDNLRKFKYGYLLVIIKLKMRLFIN